MTLFITLTLAQADTGPFNLYSNVDGYISAMAVNVPKASLLAGYSIPNAPNGTTIVKVKSMGACTTTVGLTVGTTSSTTSTSSTSSTTTSSTTSSSTTSTTTTLGPQVLRVHSICCVPNDLTVRFVNLPALLGFGPTATFTGMDGKSYTLIDSTFVTGVANVFQHNIDTTIYINCMDWVNVHLCP